MQNIAKNLFNKRKQLNPPNRIMGGNPPSVASIGDHWVCPSSFQSYVFDGKAWIPMEAWNDLKDYPNNDEDRIRFENAEAEIHQEYPELKELWDEYKLIRRLKTGK